MERKMRMIGIGFVAAVWLLLIGFVWFSPPKETSDTERRALAQMPEISTETLLNGRFMSDFETFTQDQFPLRDSFRQVKSLFHTYALQQKDNNGIYIADGYVAESLYPMDQSSVDHALGQFQKVYDRYLSQANSKIYTAVIPDKGYYLAEESGHLAMDYHALFSAVETGMPWATYVDLTDTLSKDAYYCTDTHWRQEKLLPTAQKLAAAMGITQPKLEDYTQVVATDSFYGVYYGQMALPMQPDTLHLLENDLLDDCLVYSYEKNGYSAVYNREKLAGKDPYEVYLSGPEALLRVENPNAKTDRELTVFRDSYASSLIPLLLQDYKTVTLVDLRYVQINNLGRFLEFGEADVLFLHSTLVLNKKLI